MNCTNLGEFTTPLSYYALSDLTEFYVDTIDTLEYITSLDDYNR